MSMPLSDPNRPRLLHPGDVGAALMLLTRLPAPAGLVAVHRGAAAAWAWPIAGLVVGAVTWVFGAGALAMGLPPLAAGLLAVFGAVMVTGALHEDGAADCADAFWGGRDRARRLDILKDSRIGSYGVIALVLCIGLKASLIAAAVAGSGSGPGSFGILLAAAALSRGWIAAVSGALPFAREDGLSRHVGRPEMRTTLVALALAGGIALMATGGAGLAAWIAAGIAAAAVGAVARQKIGGQTGDVLGLTQIVSELAALSVLVALLS